MIEDIVRGFIGQGFKNILIINGHFGNVVPLSFALRKLGIDFPNVGLYAVRGASLAGKVIKELRKSDVMAHACEMETSLSLVIQPENVQLDEAVKEVIKIPLSNKWWSIDSFSPKRLIHLPKRFPKMGKHAGVWGDPTVATKEFGEKVIEAAVNDLADLLLEIADAEDRVREINSWSKD
jgi:creatinine amidohydrolase